MKKIIISSLIGQNIDKYFRKAISIIPLLNSVLAKKVKTTNPESFVFFLYGGIGDAILVISLINKISEFCEVVVLCDKRLEKISFLFHSNVSIIKYNKKGFIRQSFKIKRKISKKSIFVHHTPVIELYLIKVMLGIPRSIGYISDYSKINSIGIFLKPVSVNSKNILKRYQDILKVLKSNFFYNKVQYENCIERRPKPFQSVDNSRYIVISISKSPQWKMGKMNEYEYAKVADFFAFSYGYNVIFVGSDSERSQIDRAIRKSGNCNKFINSAGETTLSELAEIIKGADFVISNDNGVSHLAAHYEKKLLVLFFFSDPEVYKWHYENYKYIFNPIKCCMPCIGFSQFPVDNYPVICRNDLICNRSMSHVHVIDEILKTKWIELDSKI